MMGSGVEAVHAQSCEEVSYSPQSLCADDEAKTGAKSILLDILEKEIY